MQIRRQSCPGAKREASRTTYLRYYLTHNSGENKFSVIAKLSHSWPVVDRAKNNVSGFSSYCSVELSLLFIRFLRLFQFGKWKIALFFSATRMCLGMLNYERAYFSGQWISRSKSLHRSPFGPTPARASAFWGQHKEIKRRVPFKYRTGMGSLITHEEIVSMIGHLRNSFGMNDCPSKQRLKWLSNHSDRRTTHARLDILDSPWNSSIILMIMVEAASAF